jgi:putative ABC transport system permease protein
MIDLSRALREGALTVTARRAQSRFLIGVVVAQLALTFALTSGAALMLKSLWNVTGPGELHDPEQVLVAAYSRETGRGEEIIITDPFQDRLLERVRALPGVLGAGATTRLPLQSGWTAGILPEGHTPGPDEADRYFAYIGCATPGYLEAIGVDLLVGRDLQVGDSIKGSLGVLVNRSFADRAWPEESPLGKRVQGGLNEDPWFEAVVVGVFADVRQNGLEFGVSPEIYLPFFPGFQRSRYITIRTEGDPLALAPTVRAELARLDPDIPLASVSTAADIYDSAAASRRFSTLLIGLFASIAICLVTAGTYGTTAFLVRQRHHEVGIRIALGADGRKILGLVLGQCVRMAGAGIALGLLGTVAASGVVGRLLYGVGPLDPRALSFAGLFLLIVVVCATLVPSIRAVRIDPVETMRGE